MKKSVLVLLLLISTSMAQAVVNLKNGNFFVEYADFDRPPTLKLARAYNSNAVTTGWFGVGWGGKLETRLRVLPDGTVAVNERGNAHTTFYGDPDDKAIAQATSKIMSAISSKEKLSTQKTTALLEKLKVDAKLRYNMATKYDVAGDDIAVGTVLSGIEFASPLDNFFGKSDLDLFAVGLDEVVALKYDYKALRKEECGRLERTKEGFERRLCTNKIFGQKDFFDTQGRLLRREDDGQTIVLTYGAAGRPESISNPGGAIIRLEWDANGRVVRARTNDPSYYERNVTDYAYNDKNELLSTTDHGANEYQYRYDKKHNLTTILYVDGTTREMTYHSNGAIKSEKKRDGALLLFTYDTAKNGDTDITYSTQKPGQPVQLRRAVSYSSKGNLIRESIGSGADRAVIEYDFHPTLGKITGKKINDNECRYEYNAAALVSRETCPSEPIDVAYEYNKNDNLSRISINRNHPIGALFDKWVSKTAKTIEINIGFDAQGRLSTVKLAGFAAYSQMDYALNPPRPKIINEQPNASGFELFLLIPMAIEKVITHTTDGVFIETGFDLIE